MSHKVTYQSEFTDSDLVKSALELSKYSFTQAGSRFHITSGPYANATIDTSKGTVEGDSDYHSKDQFGALRQNYSEAQFVRQANLTGVTIEGREVLSNGVIKLVCSATG